MCDRHHIICYNIVINWVRCQTVHDQIEVQTRCSAVRPSMPFQSLGISISKNSLSNYWYFKIL